MKHRLDDKIYFNKNRLKKTLYNTYSCVIHSTLPHITGLKQAQYTVDD